MSWSCQVQQSWNPNPLTALQANHNTMNLQNLMDSFFVMQALHRLLSSRLKAVKHFLEQGRMTSSQQEISASALFKDVLHLVQVCGRAIQ